MKKYKIIFWASSGLIFLLEGVVPALTSQSQMAKDGFTGLGYPLYFGNLLTVYKVIGALLLILPMVRGRVKEWAYAGFALDFISAFVSILVVGGFAGGAAFLPVVAMAILVVSYVSYHKLHS